MDRGGRGTGEGEGEGDAGAGRKEGLSNEILLVDSESDDAGLEGGSSMIGDGVIASLVGASLTDAGDISRTSSKDSLGLGETSFTDSGSGSPPRGSSRSRCPCRSRATFVRPMP